MMLRIGFAAALLVTLAGGPAVAQTADTPIGTWLTQAGDAKIKIAKCGATLCGKIVWLRNEIDPQTGRPAIDDKNPIPALVGRPVKGITIFNDMRPSAPGKWSGQIYNADDGKTYLSSLLMAGPGVLRVEGCVGAICGGETWSLAGK
ncbi:MAG: DUF2147 domain-containing protein [Rhodopseudomonas palustris]|nr:DUF2147 domain-containing protein [Rhodopseudomonas palustris]